MGTRNVMRTGVAVGMVVALAAGLPASASVDGPGLAKPPNWGSQTHIKEPSVSNGVPEGFVPAIPSWTSNTDGQVLGEVPCDDDFRRCHILLSTDDGGATWAELPLPDIGSPKLFSFFYTFAAKGKRTWIVVTQEDVAYVTHTGKTWRKADFGLDYVTIRTMAKVGRFVYAAIYVDGDDGSGMEYVRAPVGSDRWKKVRGLSHRNTHTYETIFGARGTTGLLEDKYFDADDLSGPFARVATTDDGAKWTLRPDVCGNGAQGLNRPVVGSADAMYFFCNYGSTNLLLVSDDGGNTFSEMGRVPGQLADAAGGCEVHSSVDGGRTWERTLSLSGGDLGWDYLMVSYMRFTDAKHGTLLCHTATGTPTDAADAYRTTDGGRTWKPLGLQTGE